MFLLIALLLQVAPTTRLDTAVREGIRAGVYPGAVVVIGTRDTVLVARGYGHFTWSEDSPTPDPASTLFDLASLTKAVATASAAMLLVDRGQLDLDDPVQRYLPEWIGEGKDRVTVRQLLEHRTGMRAFLPLHELTSSAAEARARVLSEPLRWSPGARTEYSDLNAILLGWVVEAAADQPLDVFVRDALFEPLGMANTSFAPAVDARDRMVPVGRWRGHPIAGEVHDQNAMRLGGVAGHAGLYATGEDLARLARMLLAQGALEGARLVTEETARLFTKETAGRRTLGWELRDTTTTDNTGRFLSEATFGHTGFTGTSMWIDPIRGLFVILLTNRVYAPRTRGSIGALKETRGEVADAAVAIHAACRAVGRC